MPSEWGSKNCLLKGSYRLSFNRGGGGGCRYQMEWPIALKWQGMGLFLAPPLKIYPAKLPSEKLENEFRRAITKLFIFQRLKMAIA